MMNIDEFVDSLYKGISGSEKEIKDFKEEMKSHLVETVNELKSEGKTEEESLKIAYERFGERKIINNGLFKLFNRQKKFIGIILISAIVFLSIGVISYMFMSQKDLKFQNEQKILTEGVLDSIGNENNVTNNIKIQIQNLVKKYDYINYIALFKVSDNSEFKKEIKKDDRMNIYGTYRYPFNIKSARIVYPSNIKPLTNSPYAYDRSTVVATNGDWIVQYEYKKSIYRYVENYSSRIVYSNLDYSTASFNYKNSIYFIIIGGTLLSVWIIIKIYNRFNSKLFD
ncbi:permease prefix domain 1-containing protein [Clostridium sp. JNZ X4-2]